MQPLVPADWYSIIFQSAIILLALIKILPSKDSEILTAESTQLGTFKALFIGIILIIFFGIRDPLDINNNFGDTSGYAAFFELVKNGYLSSSVGNLMSGTLDTSYEIGFFLIRDFIADCQLDVSIWFTIVASIYIIPGILGIRLLFPNHTYLAFLFWICSFGFYGGAVNGLRNADASSLFLWGFAIIMCKDNLRKYWGLVPYFIAYFFHHSIVILLLSFAASYLFIKNTNLALLIWSFAILMCLLFGNAIANFAAGIGLDDRAENYLIGGNDLESMKQSFSNVGFRWDFLLFSAAPIALSYYVTIVKGYKNKIYQTLLNTYIIANAIWIVFMYASFTNRFAALSWSLYPFVLCYPLFKFNIFPKNKNTIAALCLIGMIIFNIIF